ncbi:CHAT domain-containing protein [Annulohypoxylon nitens]|nr:CHAT domain-containing protein [Annulohypoxylon nitens]
MEQILQFVSALQTWATNVSSIFAFSINQNRPASIEEATSSGSNKKIEDYRSGYPQFSALIAAYNGFFICRRFCRLRARVLLLKQDRLTLLEQQLDQVDQDETMPLFLGKMRGDRNQQRTKLMAEIEACLSDYDSFLGKTHQILNMKTASPQDIKSLQNWLDGTGGLSGNETTFLDQRRDLTTLVSSEDDTTKDLETWVEKKFIKYYPGFRELAAHDASSNTKVYIYCGSLIQRVARLTLVCLVLFLLILPILVCGFVAMFLVSEVFAANMEELDFDIVSLEASVQQLSSSDPEYLCAVLKLTTKLRTRYLSDKVRRRIDLDNCIRLTSKAIEDSDPQNQRGAQSTTVDEIRRTLFSASLDRFNLEGSDDCLDRTIILHHKIYGESPVDKPNSRTPATVAMMQGGLLRLRFKRKRDERDLHASIDFLSHAVKYVNEDVRCHQREIGNLGQYYLLLHDQLDTRYRKDGAKEDLDKSTDTLDTLIHLKNISDSDRSLALKALCSHLVFRVERAELDESRKDCKRLAQCISGIIDTDNDPKAIAHFLGLVVRILQIPVATEVDEVLDLVSKLVEMKPGDHPDGAIAWSSFSSQKLRMMEQEASIAAYPNDTHRVSLKNQLLWRTDRSSYSNNPFDIAEAAISSASQALQRLALDDPNRSRLMTILGMAYAIDWGIDDNKWALAKRHFLDALHHRHSPLSERMRAGACLYRHASRRREWELAYEISGTMVNFYPKILLHSSTSSDKQHIVRKIPAGSNSSFAFPAAAAAQAAIMAGKGPFRALELLEAGRGLVADSFRGLRPDVLKLQVGDPVRAQQFQGLLEDINSSDAHKASKDDANHKFDELVNDIRSNPEYGDFLTSPSLEAIQKIAEEGPIVTIFTQEFICAAIIVRNDHKPVVVDLPRLKKEEMSQYPPLNSEHLSAEKMQEMLEWLWDCVAEPILENLGFKSALEDNWPRVFWVPTGPLAQFPIHAAGYHIGSDRKTVLDRVMSTYAPSIKALIYGRQSQHPIPPPSERQALLVSMEETPGRNGRLPHATKEVEIVQEACERYGLKAQRPPSARKGDVIDLLPRCTIFHFAGHGQTDTLDPSRSRLLLTDWETAPLTVGSLMDTNVGVQGQFRFLAYLSACGTGRTDFESLSDESIHLISAFQLAGFQHVIGTLWEVNDGMCEDIAKIFYEEIFKALSDRMSNRLVCWALHTATRQMRDRWLQERAKSRSHRKKKRSLASGIARLSLGIDRDDGIFRDLRRKADPPLSWIPYVHFGI